MTTLSLTFALRPVPADVVLAADAGAPLAADPTGLSVSGWVASEIAAGRPWAVVSGHVPLPGVAPPATRFVILVLE